MVSISNYSSNSEENFSLAVNPETLFKTALKQYVGNANLVLNRALEQLRELEQINKRIDRVKCMQKCGSNSCACAVQIIFNCVIPVVPIICLLSCCSKSARDRLEDLYGPNGLCRETKECCNDYGGFYCCCPSLSELQQRDEEIRYNVRSIKKIFLTEMDHPDIIYRKSQQLVKFNEERYMNVASSVFEGVFNSISNDEEESKNERYEYNDEELRRLTIFRHDDHELDNIDKESDEHTKRLQNTVEIRFLFDNVGILSDAFISSIDNTIKIRKVVGDWFRNVIPKAVINTILLDYMVDTAEYDAYIKQMRTAALQSLSDIKP